MHHLPSIHKAPLGGRHFNSYFADEEMVHEFMVLDSLTFPESHGD